MYFLIIRFFTNCYNIYIPVLCIYFFDLAQLIKNKDYKNDLINIIYSFDSLLATFSDFQYSSKIMTQLVYNWVIEIIWLIPIVKQISVFLYLILIISWSNKYFIHYLNSNNPRFLWYFPTFSVLWVTYLKSKVIMSLFKQTLVFLALNYIYLLVVPVLSLLYHPKHVYFIFAAYFISFNMYALFFLKVVYFFISLAFLLKFPETKEIYEFNFYIAKNFYTAYIVLFSYFNRLGFFKNTKLFTKIGYPSLRVYQFHQDYINFIFSKPLAHCNSFYRLFFIKTFKSSSFSSSKFFYFFKK